MVSQCVQKHTVSVHKLSCCFFIHCIHFRCSNKICACESAFRFELQHVCNRISCYTSKYFSLAEFFFLQHVLGCQCTIATDSQSNGHLYNWHRIERNQLKYVSSSSWFEIFRTNLLRNRNYGNISKLFVCHSVPPYFFSNLAFHIYYSNLTMKKTKQSSWEKNV